MKEYVALFSDYFSSASFCVDKSVALEFIFQYWDSISQLNGSHEEIPTLFYNCYLLVSTLFKLERRVAVLFRHAFPHDPELSQCLLPPPFPHFLAACLVSSSTRELIKLKATPVHPAKMFGSFLLLN